jgi:nucleoside-triphosphatase THEP1
MAPLVGRKKELAELLRLLRRDDVKHVTITGPPGIGKSRLAEEVAAELPERAGAVGTGYESRGLDGEHEYRLHPLAEAPGVELYRQLSGDYDSSYGKLAALCAALGRVPGAIVEAAARALDSR